MECTGTERHVMSCTYLPSSKRLHNYGKSPSLMGKLTISMAIFKFANCKRLPGRVIVLLAVDKSKLTHLAAMSNATWMVSMWSISQVTGFFLRKSWNETSRNPGFSWRFHAQLDHLSSFVGLQIGRLKTWIFQKNATNHQNWGCNLSAWLPTCQSLMCSVSF